MLFPDRSLAHRVARVNAGVVRSLGEVFAGSVRWEALDGGGGGAISGGSGSRINRAIGLGFDDSCDYSAVLARAEAFFDEVAEPCRVQLMPYAEKTFREALVERGYSVTGFKSVLILALGGERARPESQGVGVRTFEPSDEDPFVAALVSAYGAPHGLRFSHNEARGMLAHPWVRPVVATSTESGEIVGGAYAVIVETPEGKTALLMSAGTVPAWRGRGAQRAMIEARLRIAEETGCDLALVEASVGAPTERNAQRAGFTLAWTEPTVAKSMPGNADA